MKLSTNNFLSQIKNLVTGGGRNSDGTVKHDAGFLKRHEGISLKSVSPSAAVTATATALTVSDGAGTNDGTIGAITADASVVAAVQEIAAQTAAIITDIAALRAQLGLTADETNARVLKVEETVDSIGNVVVKIPLDYDEASDTIKVRVLASQLTVSTDNDVELDMEVYRKRAGSALTADLNPTAPGTILSTTEQWVEFDLSGNTFLRDDVLTLELITNGANDTNAEEVLIHDVEVLYRSCLVSYDKEDASENPLR